MEHQNLEWKESWRDEYLRWLCGFANGDGGTLLIGKADDGRVVGVDNAERLLVELPNKIRDLLGIVASVDLKVIEEKTLVEISVAPYPNPISYKGEYHLRSGSTKQELRGAALDQFLLRKYGRTWDSVPVPHVADADLDPVVFRLFRAKAAQTGRMNEADLADSDSVLIDRLKLREASRLTRAAVLLFHPHPDRFFSGATIKIGYFENEADLLYQDEIEGSLFEQVDKAMDLLTTKYMKALIRYEGIQRIETLPFPRVAVREALLNAVVHRDYSLGIPLQIKVFADHIVFWNVAHIAQDWTVERLLAPHGSHPYNPLIAGGFFRSGMIESWGRGIDTMRESCRIHGTPEPFFRPEVNGLWLELHALTPQTPPETRNANGKVGEKVGEKVGVKLTPNQERILVLLEADPHLAAPDLATAVGISVRKIETNLAKLKAAGKLDRIGPAKGGYWKIIKELP